MMHIALLQNHFIDDLSTYLKVLSKYYEYLTKLVEIKVLSNRENF